MVSLSQILIVLVTISLAQSDIAETDKNTNVGGSDLGSIFDDTKRNESPQGNKQNVVCDTDACKIIAKEIKRGMNTSVAPCDNFYDFVCGTWGDITQLPGYTPRWSRFHIYQDTVNRRIKGILETKPETTDILPLRQAKKWYQSCMDLDSLEKRGIRPLESILLQVGGWPMTLDPEEWNEEEHSWQSVEHDYFHITGAYVFYKFEPAWRDDSTIEVKKGTMPLHGQFPPEFPSFEEEEFKNHTEFIKTVTEMFVDYNKASVTKEMIDQDIMDLVEFEKQLFMLSQSNDRERFGGTLDDFVEWYDTNVTEAESDSKTTKIDFNNLIRRQYDLVNRQINGSINVRTIYCTYFMQLTELLNQTPTRTIVNYLHWHFVSEMLIYTTERMRNALFVIMKNEFDVKERKPRWLECIDEMKMKKATAYAFVEKYFSDEVEQAAQEMIRNVREEMKSQVDESSWMDEVSKTIVKEKLNAMRVYVGFPDWYRNRTAVVNAYKGLTIGYDHFDNVLSFKKYAIKQQLYIHDYKSQTHQIGDDEPITINAFYNPIRNVVVLPAADFQPPLFTSRVPPSVNYGTIGLAMGHEMGHGFDNDGMFYGADGNRTKLSRDMLKLFQERALCFVNQFDQYFGTAEPRHFHGMSRGFQTLGDNMADSTGLQAVFKSFQKLIVDHAIDNYKLPGFEEYTDDQMFFISFAALWCETKTPKFAKVMERFDSHSPGRFRVMGPLSNLNDFGKAFACPSGSSMNPEKKCNIWK